MPLNYQSNLNPLMHYNLTSFVQRWWDRQSHVTSITARWWTFHSQLAQKFRSNGAVKTGHGGIARFLAAPKLTRRLFSSIPEQNTFKSQKNCPWLTSFPGSPPPLYFIRAILFTRNYCAERREGESLGGFDHVWTLMTRSVAIVSTYHGMRVQKNEKEARISVLVGF